MEDYDVAVIGAGVMGLSTAWYLSHKEGRRVLLLDQFPFPTSRNSSTGHSRVYRMAYLQTEFTNMMHLALPLWKELETASNSSILHECGILYGGARSVADQVEDSLKSNNCPYRRVTGTEVCSEWPQFEGFSADDEFIFDGQAGFLSADNAMQALHHLLDKSSACSLRFKEKVQNLKPSHSHVEIVTSKGKYVASSIVVTAGPWSSDILRDLDLRLPLEPQSVAIAYFKVSDADNYAYRPFYLPCLLYDKGDLAVDILPESEYPGCIKLGNHIGFPQHPDYRDHLPGVDLIRPMTNFVQKYMPQIDPHTSTVEHCICTQTPDEYYILDHHPQFSNVIIGAGFSGHGFKMAPAVGQILSQLVVNKEPDIDMAKFKISRFGASAKL